MTKTKVPIGVTSALTASAVVLSPLAGRLRTSALISITIIYCGMVLPVFLHWTQHEEGWLRDAMYDSSGASAIHLASSVTGTVGSIFLGRRLLRVSEIDKSSVALESPSNTFTGYFLILLGLLGNLLQSLDSSIYQNDVFDSTLVVNSMMAIAGALITFVLLHSCSYSEEFYYWDIVKCLQSTVAALVAISFGIHYYLPSMAFALGAITSVFFYIISAMMDLTSLEDNCNIIAVHFTGALVGAILLPLLCKWKVLEEHATVLTRFSKCAWQAIYCLLFVVICIVIFGGVFALLKAFRSLRNEREINNHRRAIHLRRRKKTQWGGRLFRKHSTFPFAERGPDDASSSFILRTRGSEQRRHWVARPNQRRVSFSIGD